MQRKYYVTMRRDSRTAFLAGPFDEHESALALVDRARDIACEVDARAWFDAFGTSGLRLDDWGDKPLPVGRLNDRLGVVAG